jgi:hypothetical protein
MGLVGKVLEFTRTERNAAKVSDVKTDPGGGALLTSDHFQAAGTDSHPMAGDYSALVPTQGTGRYSAVGYVDPKNAQTAALGEYRTYSRKADGTQAAQVWLKADGTVLTENENGSHVLNADGSQRLQNASGYINLAADGTVDINGFIITPAGAASSPVSVSAPSIVVDGKELKDHMHPAGTPPGNTGTNL